MIRTAMRTAGIWIEEGRILLESLASAEIWGIPGGHLEPDETAEAGCLREYREELGLDMQADGLVLIHENFWRDGDQAIREYCFYFRVRNASGALRSLMDIRSQEDGLQFRWFRLDELETIEFVPIALRIVLTRLDTQTQFLSTMEQSSESGDSRI